ERIPNALCWARLRADRGYVELRAAVVGKGLLERDRVYYAWRSAVSFAVLAGGLILGVAQPGHSPLSGVLASLVIAFGSVQVALIGHDAGHLAIFKTARANLAAGWLCWSLVLGIGFPYWSDRHTRHHTRTNDLSLDPDLQWAGLVAY